MCPGRQSSKKGKKTSSGKTPKCVNSTTTKSASSAKNVKSKEKTASPSSVKKRHERHSNHGTTKINKPVTDKRDSHMPPSASAAILVVPLVQSLKPLKPQRTTHELNKLDSVQRHNDNSAASTSKLIKSADNSDKPMQGTKHDGVDKPTAQGTTTANRRRATTAATVKGSGGKIGRLKPPSRRATGKTTSEVPASPSEPSVPTGLATALSLSKYLKANSLHPSNKHWQRHSISPGAVTPPYGDVRTMICDASPVPSDVESIDYTSKTESQPSERKGPFRNVGQTQTYLRVTKKVKPQSCHSEHLDTFPKISKTSTGNGSGQRPEASSVPRNILSQREVETTMHNKSEIAVLIVPDSAKRSKTPGVPAKASQDSMISSQPKETYVRAKQPAKPTQPTLKKPLTSKPHQPQVIKAKPINSPKSEMTRSKSNKLPTPAKSRATASPDAKRPSVKIGDTLGDGNVATAPEPESHSEGHRTNDGHEDLVTDANQNPDARNTDTQNEPTEENFTDLNHVTPSPNIPADEECCKAYAILNHNGIKVSLHTLRRALLTPTEYRQLRMNSIRQTVTISETNPP